jgi:MYXO-CTERM domain-containing protein
VAGFVDDPALDELNAAVMELERAVNAKGVQVAPDWRARWKSFVARWRLELDDVEAAGASLSQADGRRRLDAFGATFQRYDADWESGAPLVARSSSSSNADSSTAWLVVVGAALLLLTRRR